MWLIDGTLSGTTITYQSEPESKGNERVLHNTQELEPHHQMQFIVNQHMLSAAEKFDQKANTIKITLYVVYS